MGSGDNGCVETGASSKKVDVTVTVNVDEFDKRSDSGDQGSTEVKHLMKMLSKLNPMAEEFNGNSRNSVSKECVGLNPMAKEFVPPSSVTRDSDGFEIVDFFPCGNGAQNLNVASFGDEYGYVETGADFGYADGYAEMEVNFGHGIRTKSFRPKRKYDSRTSRAQQLPVIKRTVYVSEIDQQVTEMELAKFFEDCGHVVDCRICGDTSSDKVLRFGFVEFDSIESAKAAVDKSGSCIDISPIKVEPSRTAIAPINPVYLPASEDEREKCARTVYCTNIDKKVTNGELRNFFETLCGKVLSLRILGDTFHATRIAFVEFAASDSATAAFSCTGMTLGSFPIRVSASKTPVRPSMTAARTDESRN